MIEQLQTLLGPSHVLTDLTCTDWRGRYSGKPLAVVRPANTEEVAAVVKLCASNHIAIVPQGGNTGLCGGATPSGGEVVVSLARLNRIRRIHHDHCIVEAGCTLAAVKEAAALQGRLFPLSLAAEGSAMIGGNLSTNAGGVQVLRYGNARELTLGLEVVLPDGRVWNGLRALRKDNTGVDLKQLFIGAEGTLGIITAAVLKLFPQPKNLVTAWVAVPNPAAALALLQRLSNVTAFELIGRMALDLVLKHVSAARDPLLDSPLWQVLIEADTTDLEEHLAAAMEAGEVTDAILAQSTAQSRTLWNLRESIPEAERAEGFAIKHDISIPLSRLPEFIARADTALSGKTIICFGHMGDGNLHYNVVTPLSHTDTINRLVYDLVHELGGSFSAEHGIGQLKRGELLHYKSEVEIDLMRTLKHAIDPQGTMNPGKVLTRMVTKPTPVT
ncbi:MAG: FAD-binding oxidoreductase, partial [Rhodocyclaceae bacterium]|nr:FAD-binding oxidoreductase [Rhodocyclaceae bacterium]